MNSFTFRLPDLGEGLTDATVLTWLVQEGDQVVIDTPLVEVETAKTTVVLPSPRKGSIVTLHAVEGQSVTVGEPLVTLDSSQQLQDGPLPTTQITHSAPAESPPLLIGFGSSPRSGGAEIKAAPPVRKLARDLQIDLADLPASGIHGEVTRDDVLRAAHADAVPVDPVRRQMSRAMTQSAVGVPQATLCVTVDLSSLLTLKTNLSETSGLARYDVTPFALLARCFVVVLKSHPLANATFDPTAGTVRYNEAVNLGVAVATERGLVVPVVHTADSLTLPEFLNTLHSRISSARAGTLTPPEMSGGTATITNIGALGVEMGIPLLHPGQSTIVALGRIQRRPWVVSDPEEHLDIRPIMTITLTIDHRILDGKDASMLLNEYAALIEDPALALRYA